MPFDNLEMSSQTSAEQPEKINRSFHVVTKPIGSLCNLDCTYCYYLHKQDLLQDKTEEKEEKGISPIIE